MRETQGAQQLHTAQLKPDQVVGIVDNAHLIGFGIAHPHLVGGHWHPACSFMAKGSRLQMSEDGQLCHVVEDDEREKHHEHHKGRLVDAFFDHDADVVTQSALDQQQQNQAAVEDRKRHKVQDAQVEADLASQVELGVPALTWAS